MSTIEPFLPHPEHRETIAAADAGVGAPAPAEGFGIAGEDDDVAHLQEREGDASQDGTVPGAPADVPFRTPDPADVRRPE